MSVTDFEPPRGGIRKGVCLIAACLAIAAIAQASAAATAPSDRSEVVVAIPRKQNLASVPRAASFDERFGAVNIPPVQVAFAMPESAVSAAPETTASLHATAAEPSPQPRAIVTAGTAIIGTASMYDPGDEGDLDAGNDELASGERYDVDGWTAAIQVDLRDRFGGVRFGKNYRPAFALVEANDKRLVVRINDVGPLKPGRIIDLNVRAMRYFDPTLQAGLIAEVKVTPLAGEDYALGPVTGPGPVTIASLDLDGAEAP
ncbi:MAG: septal ring lytic transglycosylase RlpA family protein [Pseudolabrys sp.]|jgi:rare lipoprotein A